MGKINQGILGGYSGKVGPVVGAGWKGIAYQRAMPVSVANPRTNAQIAVRTRFAALALLGSSLLSVGLRDLWDRFASKMSGYNDFMKSNYDAFDSAGTFVPAKLVWAKGKMQATAIASFTLSGGEPYVTWSDTIADSYQQDSDSAYIVVIGADGELVAFSASEYARDDAQGTLTFVEGKTSADLTGSYAYLAFLRADGSIVSDSSLLAYA